MAVDVKICGLKNRRTIKAAVDGGARYLGFNFYPPSPRAITPAEARDLTQSVPAHHLKVGVTVDPDDHLIDQVLDALDAIQLHGAETPARVSEVKNRSGKTVIKAVRIAEADDLAPLQAYAEVADIILFDAKPPAIPGNLPGGNGLRFDWRLLNGMTVEVPWILSGGLDIGNLAEAVDLCRATAVDVASGVESAPGVKDEDKIRAFLELADRLPANGPTTTEQRA